MVHTPSADLGSALDLPEHVELVSPERLAELALAAGLSRWISITGKATIFDQTTPRNDKVIGHLSTVDEIERRSGLDFMWELPDEAEARIEGDRNEVWAGEHFRE